MYGKIVEYNGYSSFLFCSPSTPEKDLKMRMKLKVEKIEKFAVFSLN